MKTNRILEEIRHTRERLFAEAGSDTARFFAMMRERQAAAQARGAVVVPVTRKTCATVREEAADHKAGWQRQWEPATNPILDEIRQAREALMAEAGGDLERFFEMVREREAAAKAQGVEFVPVPKRGKKKREAAP